MKKLITGIVVFLSALILVVFFGCSAFQDAVIPCSFSEEAAVYADANSTSWLPWKTVLDAERVDVKMDYTYQINQVKLGRLIDDDDMRYRFLKGIHTSHIKSAREFQQKIFSPSGPIGALIPTLCGGTLGALLIPRLGEKKKIEEAKEEGKREANNNAG